MDLVTLNKLNAINIRPKFKHLIDNSDHQDLPKSQKEASEKGLRFYSTGKTCKFGHVDLRYTSNKECRQCRFIKNKNPRLVELRRRNWEQNRERKNELGRYRYYLDQEKQQERGRLKWIKNSDKVRKTNKNWLDRNPKYFNHAAAKRRARLLNAIPKWADLEAIKLFYKNCPPGYHVDHIHPLQGRTVCGFHVIDNLQYLPAAENLRKSNRLEH